MINEKGKMSILGFYARFVSACFNANFNSIIIIIFLYNFDYTILENILYGNYPFTKIEH